MAIWKILGGWTAAYSLVTVLTGVKAALAYKPHPDFEFFVVVFLFFYKNKNNK